MAVLSCGNYTLESRCWRN